MGVRGRGQGPLTKKPLAPFPKENHGQERDAEKKDHDPEAQGGPGA